MKLLSALAVVLLSNHAALALNCQAQFSVNDPDKPIMRTVVLKQTYNEGAMQKFSADLEGDFYSITVDKDTGSYTLGIYEGPEYTKGSMTVGQLSEKQIRLSSVDKNVVKKVVCQ